MTSPRSPAREGHERSLIRPLFVLAVYGGAGRTRQQPGPFNSLAPSTAWPPSSPAALPVLAAPSQEFLTLVHPPCS